MPLIFPADLYSRQGYAFRTHKLGVGSFPNVRAYTFLTGSQAIADLSFARTSSGWCFNALGVLVQTAVNEPRFDYDPVTLAPKGLLIEEQRTNILPNSVGMGGSASSLPTGWSTANTDNVSVSVVGTGTEHGMTYYDIRFHGTPGATTQYPIVYFDTAGFTPGLLYSESLFAYIVAGGLAAGSEVYLKQDYYNGSGTWLANEYTRVFLTPAFTRYVNDSKTSTDPSGARIGAALVIACLVGQTTDVTVRLSGPQLEAGKFSTSYIPTSGAAVTRAKDSLSATNIAWFTPGQGTFIIEGILEGKNGDAQGTVLFSDGTQNNSLRYRAADSGASAFKITSGNTEQYSTFPASPDVGAVFKFAAAFSAAAQHAVINGGAPASHGAITMPGGINRLDLGGELGQAAGSLWLRSFKYWNTAKPVSFLQEATQ